MWYNGITVISKIINGGSTPSTGPNIKMKKLFLVSHLWFGENEINNHWITHDSKVEALLFWLEDRGWEGIPDVEGLSEDDALDSLYEYACDSDSVVHVEKVPESYDNTNVSVYSV